MTCAEQLKHSVKAIAADIENAAEEGTIADYFKDALNVEIISDLSGRYRGARIAVALGGPGIYVNTKRGCVEGYWGFDTSFEWGIGYSAVDAVDDYFSELWEMARGC